MDHPHSLWQFKREETWSPLDGMESFHCAWQTQMEKLVLSRRCLTLYLRIKKNKQTNKQTNKHRHTLISNDIIVLLIPDHEMRTVPIRYSSLRDLRTASRWLQGISWMRDPFFDAQIVYTETLCLMFSIEFQGYCLKPTVLEKLGKVTYSDCVQPIMFPTLLSVSSIPVLQAFQRFTGEQPLPKSTKPFCQKHISSIWEEQWWPPLKFDCLYPLVNVHITIWAN